MHLLLTDRLACPRCGPEFGLILLSTRTIERRVHEGAVGCANCRQQYPITGGHVDLRLPPRHTWSPDEAATPPEPALEATDLAALLGITEGPGHVLLLGRVGHAGAALTRIWDDVDVLVTMPSVREWPEEAGLERIAVSPGRLPLRSAVVRAAVLAGEDLHAWGDEIVRALQPLGRLVVLHPPADCTRTLESLGLRVILEDPRAAVGERSGGRPGVAWQHGQG